MEEGRSTEERRRRRASDWMCPILRINNVKWPGWRTEIDRPAAGEQRGKH